MTTTTGGVTYSPYPCRVKISERRNLSNKNYKVYMGVEKVSFKSEHCKGSFVHDGPLLMSMICNGPNKGILRNLLISVATYCRFNYENTRSQYPTSMHKEAAQLNKTSIHNFLRVSETEWVEWRATEGSLLGPLKIERSTEYQEAPLSHMCAEEGTMMVSRSTGQMVRMPIIPRDLPPLPAIVDSQSPVLIDSLYLSKLLRRKIRFYLENIDMLKTKITQSRFDWHNSAIVSNLSPDQKEGIGSSAVTFIQLAVARPNYSLAMVCFWYCFSGAYVGQRSPVISFLYNDVDIIDLKAVEGVVRLSGSGNLIIYGSELISNSLGKTDTGRLMTGIIPGYRFSQYLEERYPLRSLKML